MGELAEDMAHDRKFRMTRIMASMHKKGEKRIVHASFMD